MAGEVACPTEFGIFIVGSATRLTRTNRQARWPALRKFKNVLRRVGDPADQADKDGDVVEN